MNQTPPPLPSKAPQDTWIRRNWKWAVPSLGLACVAAFAAFVLFVFGLVTGMMRSSGAYEMAMQTVQTDERVTSVLGAPIEPGIMITGSISTSGSSGNANLSIPVSGPKGKAKVYLQA